MTPPPLTRRAGVLLSLLLAVVAIGACGGSDSSSSTATTKTSTGASPSQAAAENFVGDWQTTFGKLQLAQSSDGIDGSYVFCAGTLTGAASGSKLEGTWDEDTSKCDDPRSAARKVADGTFSFTLDASGNAFSGYYETTGSPQRKPWNGSRIVP